MGTSSAKNQRSSAIASTMQPAVLGRLLRLSARDDDDFTATVLHLAQRGVLRIERGEHRDTTGKPSPDYRLVRTEEAERLCENPVKKATLSLLFDTTGEGQPSTPPFKVRQAAEVFPASAV